MVGGAAQTLRPPERLDQTLRAPERLDQPDVEEREQHARYEEAHRRLDPVENVAGTGDVTERAEVDEEVLVAVFRHRRWRRRGSVDDGDIGRQVVRQVAWVTEGYTGRHVIIRQVVLGRRWTTCR